MPVISIVIPVYNVEKYLRRSVESVLAQQYDDYEIILVDDGSPDGSPAICDEYAGKHDHIRVIHKENGGLSSARNAGIEAARGEYLFFMDSDDVMHPDTLETLMTCIEKTGAQIACGEFERFTGDRPERFQTWDGECTAQTGLETLESFFDGRAWLASLVSACGKLIRRDLFEGIRFPVGRLFEDEFTTYKLYFLAGQVALSGAALYYYFVNDEGITQNLTINKRFDEYDAQMERMEFFREKGLDELLGKAAVCFLKTAQWDLIACRQGQETVDAVKKKRFEAQYTAAFNAARGLHCLDFLKDFDYYVLAKPEMTQVWRVLRQIRMRIKKP